MTQVIIILSLIHFLIRIQIQTIPSKKIKMKNSPCLYNQPYEKTYYQRFVLLYIIIRMDRLFFNERCKTDTNTRCNEKPSCINMGEHVGYEKDTSLSF